MRADSKVAIPDMRGQAGRRPYNATDLGNAERFVEQHGNVVRHVSNTSCWHIWDGTRWAVDRDGQRRRRAMDTARSIYDEAARANHESERKDLARHAVLSESRRSIDAMIELAKDLAPIATVPEAFDSAETDYLLNVENGTLDLRTGELRRHNPADAITKLAPVELIPGARSSVWDAFLEQQVPDAETRAFLARAAGYTLTANTGEEVLFLVHGPTAAGKSTLAEALKSMLGDYALTCGFETFLRRRGDAGVRDDLARLAGARMILASEPGEGRALDEAVLKSMTGGDTVSARHLYQRHFEFQPAAKLWLLTNHRPRANAQDDAVWRRVMLVPFERTVPVDERDPTVKARLMHDPDVRRAILAWAVAGCLEWQRTGLKPPAAVVAATLNYRDENDSVGKFLADEFSTPPRSVSPRELRDRYTKWCEANGERPLPPNQLGAALRQHGLVDGKSGSVRAWRFPERQQGQHGQQFRVTPLRSASREEFAETAAIGVPAAPACRTPKDVRIGADHE